MSKGFRTELVVIGAIIAGSVLLLVGIAIGRSSIDVSKSSSWNTMKGYGMGRQDAFHKNEGRMTASGHGYSRDVPYRGHDGFGMGGNMGSGMMGGYMGSGMTGGYSGSAMMGGNIGPGMMGGYKGSGMMGGYMGSAMMGHSMMSGASARYFDSAEPLGLNEATSAVEEYIVMNGDSNLVVGEVMVFDNHAYAQIVEENSGIGAMEVLVDPATLSVYPEMGPNMMWNLKYGGMGGYMGSSMMGMMSGYSDNGMMGNSSGFGMMDKIDDQAYMGFGRMMGNADVPESIDEMVVSDEDAVELAQGYLDSFLPGSQADEHADPFYGYYTIHIEQDGETIGMLSVHGFTGDVFVHTWHGTLIEMG